jgi:hypothetical protein
MEFHEVFNNAFRYGLIPDANNRNYDALMALHNAKYNEWLMHEFKEKFTAITYPDFMNDEIFDRYLKSYYKDQKQAIAESQFNIRWRKNRIKLESANKTLIFLNKPETIFAIILFFSGLFLAPLFQWLFDHFILRR